MPCTCWPHVRRRGTCSSSQPQPCRSLQLLLKCSDIKPENVFFAADGSLRLGDFGLSIDARVERPTSRVGTLDYMCAARRLCKRRLWG